jgi:hypothetical protein
VVPPIATLLTVPVPPVLVDAVPVVEAFAPSATEPLMVDEAFVPRARAPAAEAMAAFPIAIGPPLLNWTMLFPVDVVVLAVALLPIAIAPSVLALALCPTATPLLKVPCPMATVFPPKAVDSDETLLFVVLKPVEIEPTPVDSEFTPLCAVLMPVDVEVDSDVMPDPKVLATVYSWLPFIASVLDAPISPAATFCRRRSDPTCPTLTTPFGVAAADAP